jgi:hypothetical protein
LGATVFVNGERTTEMAMSGNFCGWAAAMEDSGSPRTGFAVDEARRARRPRHLDAVARLCGPLVLFAVTETATAVTRPQLLAAAKLGSQNWQVQTTAAPLKLLPFTAISDEPYASYLVVT